MSLIFFNEAKTWFITHEISNSGLREFQSGNITEGGQFSIINMTEEGLLSIENDWQYNRYPDCMTVR